MILSTNASSWAKPVMIGGGFVAAFILWAYLAGGLFLMAHGYEFDRATPLTIFKYWNQYLGVKQIEKWLYITSGGALAIVLSPLFLFFAPAKRSLFGDARFASKREVTKAGLLGENGIIVGRKHGKYLMFAGQQHSIISAPTRSGKGVGIVIPNLLNWPESVVVLDIKQENWDITSGYRAKHGQACYLFNPAAVDYRSHRYNPLSYISSDINFRIDDVQKIAGMLFPDQPGTDVIWTATPRTLFMGIVLYLLETPEKTCTIGQVLRETLVDGDGSEYFGKIIQDRQAQGRPLSSACVRALNSYTSIASENTRSGIIGGFRSKLELWMNPLVDAATSENDFDLRDVRKKRMSIYLGVTPDNLERMAPLLNLFFQQLIDLNTRELPNQNKAIKYTCMLLMDEFTAIGKIPILSKGISYIAGYWLRMMPIIQSPAQLVEVYGKDAAQTFQTNHALQIIYPPKASETQTAKDISEWLGYQTVKGKSHSKGKGLFAKKSQSESTSDQRRALMLPQEITGLGKGKELIIAEDTPPILAQKVEYFKDTVFMDRLKEVSETLRKTGNKIPNKSTMDAAIEAGELSAFVPTINLDAHNRNIASQEIPINTKPQGGNKRFIERNATAADVPNFAKMELSRFAVDFKVTNKPAPGKLDIEALDAYADAICESAGIEV